MNDIHISVFFSTLLEFLWHYSQKSKTVSFSNYILQGADAFAFCVNWTEMYVDKYEMGVSYKSIKVTKLLELV